jgi:hypothetical protein
MTMYQEHQAELGRSKLSWEDMAMAWNTDVMTELVCQPAGDQTPVFPSKTLKTGSQLKKFYQSMIRRIDNEFSRMSVTAQPKLAQATLYGFATSMLQSQRAGIDRSGSTEAGADMGGSPLDMEDNIYRFPEPQATAPGSGTLGPTADASRQSAGPSNPAGSGRQTVVGRGGPGGKNLCRLCQHIEGKDVGIDEGHGAKHCKYQQLLRVAKGNSSDAATSAAVELDNLLQSGKMPTSLHKLYPKLF